MTVAFLKGDHYWKARLRDAGVRVEPLELTRYGAFAPAIRLRRLIIGSKPDLIHAHMPPAELYTRLALLGRDLQPPLIATKHNDEPFFRGFGPRALARWVARRVMHVIVISEAIRSYMREQLALPDDRMRTVHYGIDCRPFETVDDRAPRQLRVEWGISDSDLVIGTIARLVPQKAVHVLLAAFARYRAIGRCNARLVVVGQGPLMAELKDTARRLELTDVVWAGFRDDIPEVMGAFDGFALS